MPGRFCPGPPLGAGAIAVSGMRGVRKSTVLSVLTGPSASDPDAFTVLVSAPVQYDAREFLLADPDWPPPTGAGLREAVERDLAEAGDPATSLAAALLFYATVLELFTSRQEVVDEWAAGPAGDLADDLATLHGTLPLNAPLAIRQLAQIRVDLGLAKVAPAGG